MSIRGSNFENQHPFASDHALVWERCIPDGLLYGVDMSFTTTLFTLGTGFMLVAGRMFEITAAENISISPGSGYARVYVAIDTGGAATENSFDQVSFGVDYAANLDSFTELTQGEININQGAAVYQAEVAVLAINSSGVTAIERQMELVSPGAGTGAFAAIAVTYPAGSTVTVTDGKITYTAPNTNGGALFIIPYAATWTVTATDGTETASETVEITTEGQNVSVELNYTVYFIENGVIQKQFTYDGDATLTELSGYAEFNTGGAYAEMLTLAEAYDLTNRSAIRVAVKGGYMYINAGYAPILCVGKSRPDFADRANYVPINNVDAYAQIATGSGLTTFSAKTVTLDVSALNGMYYIGVSALGDKGAGYINIVDLVLE